VCECVCESVCVCLIHAGSLCCGKLEKPVLFSLSLSLSLLVPALKKGKRKEDEDHPPISCTPFVSPHFNIFFHRKLFHVQDESAKCKTAKSLRKYVDRPVKVKMCIYVHVTMTL